MFDNEAPMQNYFREFTPWVRWALRHEMSDDEGFSIAEYAGIYLLAHFDVNTTRPGPANHLDAAIVYVGEGYWLRRRWDQFERSATRERDGHSGGHRYRSTFGNATWNQLYVAALPIWFGDARQPRSAEGWTHAYRLYVERRILWELTSARGGEHGLLNRK